MYFKIIMKCLRLLTIIVLLGVCSFGTALASEVSPSPSPTESPSPSPSTSVSPSPSPTAPTRTYTVRYSAGGGKNFPGTSKVAAGTVVNQPEAIPTRVGYRFDGWYLNSAKTLAAAFPVTINVNTVFTAKWTPLPSVTFSTGGGKPSIARVYVKENESLGSITSLAKKGYVFSGWYTDPKFSPTSAFSVDTPITGAVKLYAKWTKLPSVTFVTSGGPKLAKLDLAVDQSVSAPPPEQMIKSGYQFEGWYKNAKFTEVFTFPQTVVGDVKVYAKWKKLPSVTFVTNGGPRFTKKSLGIEDVISPPPVEQMFKSGYEFAGWYSNSKASAGSEFKFGEKAVGDVKVYAKWIRNPVVTFSAKGKATNPPKQYLKVGEKAIRPPDLSKTGYTFVGWCSDSACETLFNFDTTVVEKNITLYAKWTQLPKLLES